MKDIERNIRAYVARSAGGMGLSDFTLDCFVGMIETGEATAEDFLRVGGKNLRNKVWRRMNLLEQKRMKMEASKK